MVQPPEREDAEFTPRARQFEKLVRDGLEPLAQDLSTAMRTLLTTPAPAGARTLWFQASHSTRHGFPVVYYFMGQPGQDAVTSARRLLPNVPESFRYLKEGDEESDEPDPIEDFDEDVPVGAYEYAGRILLYVVAEAFASAGGDQYPLASYAGRHGSDWCFDMKTGAWAQQSDVFAGEV